MSVIGLIDHFSTFTELPIKVADVVALILKMGIQDEIQFIGVDLDTAVLRGQICRYTRRNTVYGDPIWCSDIYYARGQDAEWRRIVCVKELIHIFDKNSRVTVSEKDVRHLIDRISMPPDLQNIRNDGLQVGMDRLADMQALAILLPKDARDLLMPHYEAEKLTDGDIASIACVPERYVRLVMSKQWNDILPALRDLGA